MFETIALVTGPKDRRGSALNRRAAPSRALALALLVAAGSVPAALADNVCDPGEAPDIVTGDVFGAQRYGTIGDITAYAIGTTSCNLGTCQANWISNTADHPLIAQNLFRLKNGRYEHIGQSWLKHASAALQGSTCSSSCQSADGSHLGINCSDPYGSGLNGGQSRLGPKFEVNPFTGVYPYPATSMSTTGDAIYKRLQVHNADLDPGLNAGALYFAVAQYVSLDDSTGGNGANNVSWRTASITGTAGSGVYTLSITGSTVRAKPAVDAWKTSDPGVVLTTANAPGDGTIVIAARATSLGGGMYHYEYAVENINSDRAVATFRIPLPAGAFVTNTGFHDVDYHSGEPIDGTDWTVTVGPTSVMWSTIPYSTNPNANALRWGTVYNFRFDANVAPAPANTTALLGLFKPGFLGSFGMSTLGPDLCVPNGACEPGETCSSCAVDCQGQGGGSGCCGNGSCEAGENPCRCLADCGSRFVNESSCANTIDEDCDGLMDCADTDCCTSSACAAQDADGDHFAASCDCDNANGLVHATPGEVRGLLVSRDASGAALVSWSPPLDPGGVAVRYDTLRSPASSDFVGAAQCVETGGSDTSTLDTVPTAPGIFCYLARAVNDCPVGQGVIGMQPNGQPMPARTCP
jgi:hypothetical protein